MSRKISDYFSVDPKKLKVDKTDKYCEDVTEIPENLKGKEKFSNLPKFRECCVVLEDIRHQISNQKLNLFEEIPLNYFQQIKNEGRQNDENKCRFCGKMFSRKPNLAEHLRKVHPNELELFNCEMCNKKFMDEKGLKIHEKKKHFDEKANTKTFECDFCGKVFRKKSTFYTHLRVHLPSVKCEFCQKVVKINSLKEHQKVFHSALSTQHSAYLKRHEKNHNKNFKCEICSKMFILQCYLNEHKREYHENPKSFECEICCKKFNRKYHLERHQKTHDWYRSKSFKCNRCDYATDGKHHLKIHKKHHENQDKKFVAMKNPLKCEECPTFHKNKQRLWQHMHQVHPKVLFQCDLCAKFIKVKQNLVRHMKNCAKKLKFEKY